MDARQLLDSLLGGGTGTPGRMGQVRQQFERSPLNSFGGGAALGGVLGLLLGGKGRNLMGYGGAAALGAMALRAYQQWQQGQAGVAAPSAAASAAPPSPAGPPHSLPAADGQPLELTLLRAIVGAARADGRIDEREMQHLFDKVGDLDLDAQAKAAVFDMVNRPTDLSSFGPGIGTEAQRAEVYLAARLATDVDHPAERQYLDALAARLALPAGLRTELDAQAGG